MLSVLFLLLLLYSIWVLWISSQLERLKIENQIDQPQDEPGKDQPQISVVVVFRNEKENLPGLLENFMAQKLKEKTFEIILVNDNSTDGSEELVLSFSKKIKNIRLLNLGNPGIDSPKKRAIEMAVRECASPFILFTDADCRMGPNWVESYLSMAKRDNPIFIGGLVFRGAPGFRGKWERIESLILATFSALGFSGKSPFMANGGNLLISNEISNSQPFKGNMGRISGDDISLMNSAIRLGPEKIRFNNYVGSFVFTSESGGLSDFVHQKIRWAGKWKLNESGKISVLPALLFFFYFFYSVFLMLGLVGFYENPIFWIGLLVKMISEMVLCIVAARKFSFPFSWFGFLIFEIVFSFYFILFGLISRLIPYSWKGRKYLKHG
jgi:glycosyltransferase involved in cell wall biosynthesis